MDERIDIDGAEGEGGGQVVRTSLALAMATGRPLRIRNVRARRGRPGLLRQHLTALKAIAAMCEGEVRGASLGSREVELRPGRVRHGEHTFAVGSAGSAALVLQTLVTGLLGHAGESRLTIEGGTDNPAAPPSRFLTEVWAPRVRQLGVDLHVEVERRGYYPAGGGRLVVTLRVPERLEGFEVRARGPIEERLAVAIVSALPKAVARRELGVLRTVLGFGKDEVRVEEEASPVGPGNVVSVGFRADSGREVFSAFGQRGKRAEDLAHALANEAQRWLAAEVPVGEHQADQLILLLAIAGGGAFVTTRPSLHTRTQIGLIPRFLPVRIALDEERDRDRATLVVTPSR